MKRTPMLAVLALLAVAAPARSADAPAAKASPWDALRFLEVRNTSVYPPQERNPKGERHEDRGLVSFDRARRRFVLRQFHVEGFVNQYAADSLGAAPDSIVFTSEAIENIPPGFRARETWRFVSPGELHEHFELAEPGKGFETYSRAILRRQR